MHTIRPGHQLPGRVLFTSREQAGRLYPLGLFQNPPKQTGAGPSEHLVVQIKLTLSERQRTRAHFYTLLLECIRAPCGTAARIADGSPLQAACVASLRTRGVPLAPLCGYPHNAAASLSPCWSCEAWSRTDRCVRLDVLRPVRGLGEPQQAASEYRKRYSDALLAYVIVYSLNLLPVCVIMHSAKPG